MDHRDDTLPLGIPPDHAAQPPMARKQPELAADDSVDAPIDAPITAFGSNIGNAIQLELPQTSEHAETPSTDSLLVELSKLAAERNAEQDSGHRWPPARPRSWPKSWPWLEKRGQTESGNWSPPWPTSALPRDEERDQTTDRKRDEEKLDAEIPTLTTQFNDKPAAAGWQLTLGPRSAIAAAAVLVMAIAVTADSMWMSSSLDTRINELSAALKAQQQRPQPTPQPLQMQPIADTVGMDALREEVALLQQQVNELTAGLDEAITAAVQPPEDQQQLAQRIDELEQVTAQWQQHQQQTRKRTAALAKQVEKLKPATAAPVSSGKKAATRSVAKATPKAPRSSKGPWVVNLLSVSSRPEAERERNRLADMGIKAEIGSADVKGQTWYRIRVAGFASASKAQDFGDRIAVQTGLKGAWAGKK